MSGFRSNGGSMRKAAATSRRGGQSKQEIEPPGSVDERPARDPEEKAGGSFPATAVIFQIVSVIFRIPSRIHLQRSTTGCRRWWCGPGKKSQEGPVPSSGTKWTWCRISPEVGFPTDGCGMINELHHCCMHWLSCRKSILISSTTQSRIWQRRRS